MGIKFLVLTNFQETVSRFLTNLVEEAKRTGLYWLSSLLLNWTSARMKWRRSTGMGVGAWWFGFCQSLGVHSRGQMIGSDVLTYMCRLPKAPSSPVIAFS